MNSSRQIKRRGHTVLNRIADRVDLAIDVMTLGQYGLEQAPSADGAGCEGTGHGSGWETRSQPTRRRGACEPAMSWDWPSARRDHTAR